MSNRKYENIGKGKCIHIKLDKESMARGFDDNMDTGKELKKAWLKAII